MGVDTVRMAVGFPLASGCAGRAAAAAERVGFCRVIVCAGTRDRVDAGTQGDEFFAGPDPVEQFGLEIDEPDVEDQAGPVQIDELARGRFERFGAGSGRYEYPDRKIIARDAADDAAQRRNRDVEDVPIFGLVFGTGGCACD